MLFNSVQFGFYFSFNNLWFANLTNKIKWKTKQYYWWWCQPKRIQWKYLITCRYAKRLQGFLIHSTTNHQSSVTSKERNQKRPSKNIWTPNWCFLASSSSIGIKHWLVSNDHHHLKNISSTYFHFWFSLKQSINFYQIFLTLIGNIDCKFCHQTNVKLLTGTVHQVQQLKFKVCFGEIHIECYLC